MAKILRTSSKRRGDRDKCVLSLQQALDEYESEHPGADASLYRQNPGSVRVRIVDDRFAGMTRSRRHDHVWEFLSERVSNDVMAEVSVLILLPTAELKTSLANLEFEDPTPSRL